MSCRHLAAGLAMLLVHRAGGAAGRAAGRAPAGAVRHRRGAPAWRRVHSERPVGRGPGPARGAHRVAPARGRHAAAAACPGCAAEGSRLYCLVSSPLSVDQKKQDEVVKADHAQVFSST